VRDALARLAERHEVAGAVLVGGTEKLSAAGDDTYGVPLVKGVGNQVEALIEAIGRFTPDLIFDLSDEPVIGYEERFRLASHALARGLAYEGADFRFEPPRAERVAAKPSIAIVGTGKRVGKTGVSAFFARRLAASGRLPVVVAMGRGGPAEPELIRGDEIELTVDELIARSSAGAHAASDYFEDAVMSRVPTVGSRRCAGGLAGATFVDTVLEGAAVANGVTDAELQVYEGSGAAWPPVATDATLLVAPVTQPVQEIAGLFGTYRLLRSDLLVVTMCEPTVPSDSLLALEHAVRRERGSFPIIHTVFRPKPLGSIRGKRVFLATTAAPAMLDTLSAHLATHHGCEVAYASPNLSDRPKLIEDLNRAGSFDALVTELKAAAVDVAATEARRRGAEVVLLDNEPVDAGEPGALDAALDELVWTALSRFEPPAG
jgi:cyclic 2,3-diphosphoglycerate synthetase